MIKPGSLLWQYLSPPQRVLAGDGEFLIKDSENHTSEEPTDYSYVVFPFAKMYEGFLKQLLLDLSLISEHEYYGDKFRIGKALSPHFFRNGESVYAKLEKRFGSELALHMWETWKECRNLVFHYFPHNYRALLRSQAIELVDRLIETMEEAVEVTHVRPKQRKDVCYIGTGSSHETLTSLTSLAKHAKNGVS